MSNRRHSVMPIDAGFYLRVIEAVARVDISARHAARPFRSEVRCHVVSFLHHLFGKAEL